jgi:ArsR family transcriptional regulator
MKPAELVKIAKALSDPTRLRIYQSISACREMFCGEIVKGYRLTPGTVSHHLRILAEANLIECRREGQFIYNRSRPETIREYASTLITTATRKTHRKKKETKRKAASLSADG